VMGDQPTQFSNLAERLIEQSPDAMVFTDTRGIIHVWNSAAERIFGFSESAALGESLDIIIPERFREAHWQGFRRAIVERATKYQGQVLSTKSVGSDGTRIYVELSFAIILDAKGEVLGVLAHARDITKRFEQERGDAKGLQKNEGN
jgi:PAS domain S-box-containing protein